MTRRKPRFTPDPPPYNATPEALLAWANEQFQRIEDYWPQDYGERVAALEEIQSVLRQTGNWPISGQGTMRFTGSVVSSFVLACSDVVGYEPTDVTGVTFNSDYALSYSSAEDLVIASGTDGSTALGVLSLDVVGESLTTEYGEPTWAGHLLFSAGAEQGTEDSLAVTRRNIANNQRLIRHYSLPNYTVLGAWYLGSQGNIRVVCETNSYVIFTQDTNMYRATKGSYSPTFTPQRIFQPTGYYTDNSLAATVDDNSVLFAVIDSGGDRGISLWEGTGTASLVESDLENTYSITSWIGNALRVGSTVYWPYTASSKTYLMKTDLSGNITGTIEIISDAAVSTENQNFIDYNEATNGIYWFWGAKIYKMDVSTEVIESCTPDTPAEWGSSTYEAGIAVNGEYVYLVDRSVTVSGTTTVGIAKVKVHDFS